MMERLAQSAAEQDTPNEFWCQVESLSYMNCLDIGAPSTLSNIINLTAFGTNTLADSVAPPSSMVVTTNGTNIFGQDIQCDGRIVGDGQINVFDIAVVISYVFQDTPYAHLSTNPALVNTVSGRAHIGDLCDSDMSRLQYLTNYSSDTCFYMSDHARRLSEEGYSLSPFSHSSGRIGSRIPRRRL